MKKIIALVFCLIFIFSFAAAVQADGIPDSKKTLVHDNAGLLSQSEIDSLITRLKKLGDNYSADIVLVTTSGLGTYSNEKEYADNFYDSNGYSGNGVLLLYCENPRGVWISTTGACRYGYTEAKIESICDDIIPYLKDAEYNAAFEKFIDISEEILPRVQTLKMFGTIKIVAGMIFFALFGAFVLISILVSSMNKVRKQFNARAYEQDFRITNQSDIFLYSHTTKIRIESSSGGGSGGGGGRSHGGGGQRF